MNVSESMTINPVTCSPDINIYQAIEVMKNEGVHRLPVIENGCLVGIISEKDIMKASPADGSKVSIHEMAYLLSKMVVRDVMSTELVAVSPDATVEEATRIMWTMRFLACRLQQITVF